MRAMPSIIAPAGGAGDHRMHFLRDARAPLGRRIDEQRVHDRRSTVVRDAVLAHQVEDEFGIDLAETHVCPALAATVQGKHQPLQWNIGSVHRKTACFGMDHSRMLLMPFMYAPRWWYTTPFGLPVVPEV